MKIGDIKVGTEYGALDKPSRGNHQLPRQVEAVEITTEEKSVWTSGGFTGHRSTRNVRVVKVKMLDEPRAGSRHWDEIATAKKGAILTVEARQLVGAWKDLRADVKARIDEAQAKADAKAAMESRINALLPKRLQKEWSHVDAHPHYSKKNVMLVSAKLDNEVLETIISLAEKGAAVEA